MVAGTDEHGTPIMVAADREGVTPRELATATTRSSARTCATSASPTTSSRARPRTTTTRSRATSSAPCTSKGYIVEQTALGAFSATTGHTLPDRYVEGTCPICGYTGARGDQCDNCGNQLDPVDLIEPRSRVDGQPPTFRETEHLFLDLPAFADALRSWIEAQDALAAERAPLLAQPGRRAQGPADHPRPRLGRAHPARGLRRPRRQAHLRLVRRGHRLPLARPSSGPRAGRPRRLARVVAEPGGARTSTSWARTTSSSTA